MTNSDVRVRSKTVNYLLVWIRTTSKSGYGWCKSCWSLSFGANLRFFLRTTLLTRFCGLETLGLEEPPSSRASTVKPSITRVRWLLRCKSNSFWIRWKSNLSTLPSPRSVSAYSSGTPLFKSEVINCSTVQLLFPHQFATEVNQYSQSRIQWKLTIANLKGTKKYESNKVRSNESARKRSHTQG